MADRSPDRSLADRMLHLPRAGKRLLVLALDCLLCVASVQVAFYLRLGEWSAVGGRPLYATVAAIILALPLFVTLGLYRAIFRHAGPAAINAIFRACALFAVPYVLLVTWVGLPGVPRTIGILEPLLLFFFVSGSRAAANWWLGTTYRVMIREKTLPRAVIYGAGGAGRQLASAIGQTRELALVGFVDDDPALIGSTMAGQRIWGPGDVDLLKRRHGVTEVLLAIPSAARTQRARIVGEMAERGLHVRMLPAMIDIARGRVSVADLKEVAIEDLLSRPTIPPDPDLLARDIAGRVVMVTGAGGSIGSELCRQIAAVGPARLLLVESGEFNLYAIHAELEAVAAGAFEVVPLLASVRDAERLARIFAAWRPDTVYHAAAYKHVPLVEHNPTDGIANNVFGTLVTARAAIAQGVRNFILISSDKAVRPTNVMGATKRLAELVVQALTAAHPGHRFCMVRFGNVLGSSGSVVPLFRRQIAAGGPVTITDAEMTRYFMTIPEAAQLVVQAGAMATGGEVFVLEMGEPVRILQLARNMIQLSGLSVRDADNPNGDIAIETVGLRPGEKLYEELLIGNNPAPSSHPRIMQASEAMIGWDALAPQLVELERLVAAGDAAGARDLLQALVPEYVPQGEVVDWVTLEGGAAT